MPESHLVVDGSNIATEGRTLPSLRQLDEAVRAFLAERPHQVCTVVVDATFEHRIDSSERKVYDEAVSANELLSPPAGSVGRGDKFLLEIAERAGATVFSNDSFQEFHGEYEWLFQPGRLIGGKPVPGVGWVFVERTPVRGPKSRQATRAANKKRAVKATPVPAREAAPKAVAADRPRKAKRTDSGQAGSSAAAAPAVKAPGTRGRAKPASTEDSSAARPPARTPRVLPALNEPLPFIEFVARHQTGSTVTGTVAEFSSHGAYVEIDGVRCYAPLRLLGEPPPRSVREVLSRGEQREFVVVAINAARRGIDVGLPGIASAASERTDAAKRASGRSAPTPGKTGRAARRVLSDQAPGAPGAEQPESEATLAPTKKASARKAPARKTTARKASAKKSTARKSTARKSPAKKSTAKKSTARKSTAKKSTARKSTAKKSTARKSTAKRKSAAAKTLAKKSTARKSTAKRKSAAAKTLAKKSTARKSTAKKSTARKAPARKTTARKTTARKSTAKRATKRTTKR
jgi:hypothetical protein